MDDDLKFGLQRKFGIFGLLLVMLLFVGLTFYVFTLFTPLVIVEESNDSVTNKSLNLTPSAPDIILNTDPEELLVVVSSLAKEVVFIDTSTDKIVERIALSYESDFAFFDKTQGRLYIAHSDEYVISVINVKNRLLIRNIELSEKPGDLVVADGLVYIVIPDKEKVFVVDPLTEVVDKEIPVGKEPQRIIASNDASQLFVSNFRSDTVGVINPNVQAVSSSIKINSRPFALGLSRTGRYLAVTNSVESKITIVPLKFPKRTRAVGVETAPSGVAFTPRDQLVLVANEGSNTVSFVSLNQDRVVDSVEVGIAPSNIVISSDGRKAYVANARDDYVSVLDVEGISVVKSILVGDGPIEVFLVNV
tara:strand:+ start:18925 stop:20010 length:1086 start_codon:yes stop_codon:yes gene_type:complete